MIEESTGYKKLLEAVERDEEKSSGMHDYRGKMQWVLDRAQHYADATGLTQEEILDAWEEQRGYWYMNWYQECNQPEIGDGTVRVFDTNKDVRESIGKPAFRCPWCGGVSTDPQQCDTGSLVKNIKDGEDGPCNWKAYGLFGTMGKGAYLFVKEEMRIYHIFMPVAWEEEHVDSS